MGQLPQVPESKLRGAVQVVRAAVQPAVHRKVLQAGKLCRRLASTDAEVLEHSQRSLLHFYQLLQAQHADTAELHAICEQFEMLQLNDSAGKCIAGSDICRQYIRNP